MAQRFAGKVAVVTGGGGGIGGAVALDLASQGARLVINDIGKDEKGVSEADNMVSKIKKAGGTAVANYDTVATMAGGANIIKTAISNFGRIDILVNAAGFSKRGRTVELPEEMWDAEITVHLKGHFGCSKAAAIEMIKQKSGGRIINFSSSAGFAFANVPFFNIAYSTAKAGIVGFTARLSAELQEYGITVNGIFPSAVTKGFPDPRPGADGPEFVAPVIVYLVSEEAKNITGQFFSANGGNVGIYARPMQGPSTLYCKTGKWTFEELSQIVPKLASSG
ncbi:MAG: family oxidoreductase [Chloroflexi bacterium]|nr:family oxidoreductase [Chloroflexota bacterium]